MYYGHRRRNDFIYVRPIALFYFTFLFIYSLLEQLHNLPHLSPPVSLQRRTCPHQTRQRFLCLASKHHIHALHAQIVSIKPLQYYECLTSSTASLLFVLLTKFDPAQFPNNLLREFAGKFFSTLTHPLCALPGPIRRAAVYRQV